MACEYNINYVTKLPLLFILYVSFANVSVSQSLQFITLELEHNLPNQINTQSLYNFYKRKENNKVQAFKDSQLPVAYALIPGLGTSTIYNPNLNRLQVFPSISISLSQFIRTKREAKKAEARIQKIKDYITEAEFKSLMQLSG